MCSSLLNALGTRSLSTIVKKEARMLAKGSSPFFVFGFLAAAGKVDETVEGVDL